MTSAGTIALVVFTAQFIGKAIPDSATGGWAVLRKVAKLVGLYIKNQE